MHNFGNLQAFKKRYFGRLWDQAMTKAGLESSANKICKPTANQRATRTKRNGESGAKSKTKMARPKRGAGNRNKPQLFLRFSHCSRDHGYHFGYTGGNTRN
jgi:hypothetical protein